MTSSSVMIAAQIPDLWVGGRGVSISGHSAPVCRRRHGRNFSGGPPGDRLASVAGAEIFLVWAKILLEGGPFPRQTALMKTTSTCRCGRSLPFRVGILSLNPTGRRMNQLDTIALP
jgi:hypothetical protein